MLCNKVIDSAISQIHLEQLLAVDDRNFDQWLHDLRDLGCTHLNNANFFGEVKHNHIYENVGRAILLATVSRTLVFDIKYQTTAYTMVHILMNKF